MSLTENSRFCLDKFLDQPLRLLIFGTYGVSGGCLAEHLSLLSLLDKIDFLASASLSAVQLFPPNDSLSQSLVLVSCLDTKIIFKIKMNAIK